MKTLALATGILLCLTVHPTASHADTEAAPYPWLTVSPDRNFVFKMATYRFNLKTGEIVAVGRDEAAKGFVARIVEEQEREARDGDR